MRSSEPNSPDTRTTSSTSSSSSPRTFEATWLPWGTPPSTNSSAGDLLIPDAEVLGARDKLHGIDLSKILTPSASIRPGAAVRNVTVQDHGLELALDKTLIEVAKPAIEKGEKVTTRVPCRTLTAPSAACSRTR